MSPDHFFECLDGHLVAQPIGGQDDRLHRQHRFSGGDVGVGQGQSQPRELVHLGGQLFQEGDGLFLVRSQLRQGSQGQEHLRILRLGAARAGQKPKELRFARLLLGDPLQPDRHLGRGRRGVRLQGVFQVLERLLVLSHLEQQVHQREAQGQVLVVAGENRLQPPADPVPFFGVLFEDLSVGLSRPNGVPDPLQRQGHVIRRVKRSLGELG